MNPTGKDWGKLIELLTEVHETIKFTPEQEEDERIVIIIMWCIMLSEKAERSRIASLIDQMPFGDTSASFAAWIRNGAVSNSIEDHTKGENDVAIPNT